MISFKRKVMFSASRRDSIQTKPFTIASPHVIFRSNWLERTPEIRDLLALTIKKLNYLKSLESPLLRIENSNTVQNIIQTSLLSPSELREVEMFFYLFMRDMAYGFEDPFDVIEHRLLKEVEKQAKMKRFQFKFDPPLDTLPLERYLEYEFQFKKGLKQMLHDVICRTESDYNISHIEKIILAGFFLDRDQIAEWDQIAGYNNGNIHGLMQGRGWEFAMMKGLEEKGMPFSSSDEYDYFEDPYSNDRNWKVPLPGFSKRIPSLPILNLEENISWVANLEPLFITAAAERSHLRTESYYYIDKKELMERVKYLLCKGLCNDVEPTTMIEVEELYYKLLNFRGAVMWQIASDQFPRDEVIFLWNSSMISQSLERAWHLIPTPERVDSSIQNFKVTHHGMIKDWNGLVPVVNTEVWTNDQLRDALGHDWMYDRRLILEDDQRLILNRNLATRQNLTLEKNDWTNMKRFIDLQAVKKILSQIIFSNLSINGNQGILTETGSNRLFLEEFTPRQILEYLNHSDEPVNLRDLLLEDEEQVEGDMYDDDEKELVKQDFDEQPRIVLNLLLDDFECKDDNSRSEDECNDEGGVIEMTENTLDVSLIW